MIIEKVGFGNENEAFVENRLRKGVNVIYSDDNNKGKTLLMQGMMFALGNSPIFPSGFNYNDYYFYTSIRIKDKRYEFLRKRNTVIVKGEALFRICESISELKYFLNRNLFELPVIRKKDEEQLVDMSLFYQLFFIGQDKRNTSNTINNGRYNKEDFINMLYSLNGCQVIDRTISEEEDKEKINDLKTEMKNIKKLMKLKKKNSRVAQLTNKTNDLEEYKKQAKKIQDIRDSITKYKNSRAREFNRKIKLENLVKELNSLNREIKQGKVICGECGSKQIIYSNKDINFEISNKTVRNQILQSITEEIKIKSEIIDEYSEYINSDQNRLKETMRSLPTEVWEILLCSEEILEDKDYDIRLSEIQRELVELENRKVYEMDMDKKSKDKNKKMLETIIKKMNSYYSKVDPNGNLYFDELFTKKDETYSGSEEQEYYYARLMAINSYFKHQYPIIIDAFRGGELSSKKEQIMLENYIELDKQVILTATLKDEEYNSEKYEGIKIFLVLIIV
ncbi:putative cytoplasmic protein [Gottschalkia acidurici 9a]|uniref:Cytoplasmic protein n=1 Tax=Gottschalkia acidurici (strain ATCC 7906 / DSM 604 / BCRC 14475 / CIP 104303 / KCTC 5404 / NCIMB 10678 / 9a) TaxID=1128398 RepID=K0AZH7_GOTA9|nr:hypothetical protein [Gottschalkia acidurici]AFS78115.1 putative cytoplasmic protein [Gottschalkia acidurici 9a]